MQRDITGTLLRSLLKKIKSLCDYIEKSYGRLLHTPTVRYTTSRVEESQENRTEKTKEVGLCRRSTQRIWMTHRSTCSKNYSKTNNRKDEQTLEKYVY